MPVYEYCCQKCGKTSSILEKNLERKVFWSRIFNKSSKKCDFCGSKKLTRIFSNFSVNSSQSSADLLNDVSKMGPVNFVPDYRPKGPPPGGCPYAQQQPSSSQPEKKVDRIKLS